MRKKKKKQVGVIPPLNIVRKMIRSKAYKRMRDKDND